ncbi:ABC-2 transporter permease [Lysinibacillus piscis]|uniref:ABC-2 transporter permease n=1 Tax=Lysinibacillus piscis TaxID=2518931 RepID=A0ABQ5NGB0_9BACI|nr:ABC-2 transporter permease [Lysinibacillus sp. KH24]GLC87347.1 hypothetical protein LYSBPC_04740 [Lysinibacillus sp. KH24]
MKALLVKDSMMVQQQLKIHMLFPLLTIMFLLMMDTDHLMMLTIIIFSTGQSLLPFLEEKQAKWAQYLNTLPISKKEIIYSKYTVSSLLIICHNLIMLPIASFMFSGNTFESNHFLYTGSLLFTLACCALAFALPCYIYSQHIAVAIAPLFFIIGVAKMIFTDIAQFTTAILLIGPVVGLILLWLSSFVSIALYTKREF